ncbi:MAG: glycosyltransferase family protein, partial [Bacteroidota bacterium]
MKILYAVQGTGNGHLSRAIAVVPELMEHGTVDVLISGTQSQIEFPFPVKYRFKGLSFVSSRAGGVHILKTLLTLKPFRFWKEINLVPVEDYDLVITDFEPVSAWACKRKGIPCVEMSHQAAAR